MISPAVDVCSGIHFDGNRASQRLGESRDRRWCIVEFMDTDGERRRAVRVEVRLIDGIVTRRGQVIRGDCPNAGQGAMGARETRNSRHDKARQAQAAALVTAGYLNFINFIIGRTFFFLTTSLHRPTTDSISPRLSP